MEFAYTILYVEDVKNTSIFYEKAFGFKCTFITPEKDYATLSTGQTTIAFASIALGNDNFGQNINYANASSAPFGIELAFTTKNIATDFKKAIAAGAVLMEPVVQKPWGQQVGYLRDINGFIIEICTPIEAG